jgi:hypothetical protein
MAATTIKDGFNGGSDNQLKVNSDGSINVNGGGGGGTTDVNIHDSAGNSLTSTSGALNVNTTGSSTVTGTVTTNESGLNSYKTSQYTVGTSEVQLAPIPLANRSSVSFKVHTTSSNDFILFAQAAGQAATNGYRLDDGESMQMDLTDSGSIYTIGSSPGQMVYLLEIA